MWDAQKFFSNLFKDSMSKIVFGQPQLYLLYSVMLAANQEFEAEMQCDVTHHRPVYRPFLFGSEICIANPSTNMKTSVLTVIISEDFFNLTIVIDSAMSQSQATTTQVEGDHMSSGLKAQPSLN